MKFWDWLKRAMNLPQTVKSDPQARQIIYVPVRHAGVTVDHDTALKFSAVFRAVAFISQTIACLPWMIIRERGESKTRLFTHPIAGLLHKRPNPEMSAVAFRETLTAWALTWGNGYAEIERDAGGRPAALWPLSPDRVEVKRDRDTQEIIYAVSNYFGGTRYLTPANMFHLHGLGFDGLVGYSVISLAARSIGLSIAAETVGEDFFANGMIQHGYLTHPQKLSPGAKERLAAGLKEESSGHGKRFNPLIFEEGMEWKNFSIPMEDAQMLETREFQVSDIARWFGIPPHKLAQMTKVSYSSIEAQSIEVVNDALMPWVIRLEQEANYKLFRGTEQGLYTKLNLTSLLRGDNKSRGEFYQMMRNMGVFSANDILRLEDMDPIGPEGDARIVQVNMTTLERLVEGPPEVAPALPAPAPDAQQARAAYLILFEEAQNRIFKREIGQFNQVLHKLQDKSEDFSDWSERFFAKHREWMEQILQPLVFSLAALLAPTAKMNGNLSSVLDAYIEAHFQASQEALLAVYQGELADYGEQRQAKQAANTLIEQVLTCITLSGASHEEMVQH